MLSALYFEKQNDKIICKLCPRECTIAIGQTGSCQIRTNINNSLIPLTLNKFCSVAIDPIEKKPLYHFYPGERILSLGSIGCNFHCKHCQNWEISQPHRSSQKPFLYENTVEEIISRTQQNKIGMVAFTYNEPLVQIETLQDYLPKIQQAGIKTVLVTNLYINKDPLTNILPHVDALSIDIKAFDATSYKTLTTANALETVKNNIILCFEHKKHIELVTNLVTGINDNIEQLKATADWINSISPDIPWHISCFYPTFEYKNKQHINREFLNEIENLKKSFPLNYVYTRQDQNTYCPNCTNTIISRTNFEVLNKPTSNTCPYCQKEVPYLHV